MRSEINAYDKGRGLFYRGKPRKPTNDTQFMEYIATIVNTQDLSSRQQKANEINEWKRGWDDGQKESKTKTEVNAAPVKKKAKKKTAKKRTKK